ncbi:MAG: hypothetical protein JO051_02230, partial [Acidobacteriaceae bacterium]|nr:hypothetical protein [Acidobacteriaceae bacterium]
MRKRHKLRKSLLVGGAVFAGYVGVLALVTAYKICRIKAKAKPPGKSRFEAWQTDDCQPIPKHIYRRPDPLIYSQQYLMSQGLAVTWNN